ncbi:MAG TPA: hypothetical protein VF075_08950, partial [Pyrinomonadaceae bacterium]
MITMQVIGRTVLFLTWAIWAIILGVIALMALRLIADGMDLNPFAWTSRTIRRLTDGLVMPMRSGLRRLTIDPKFAPLVVILIVI